MKEVTVMDPYAIKLLILFAGMAITGVIAAHLERRRRDREA